MRWPRRPAPSPYPAPVGVPTGLTRYELEVLQRYAAEAGTVLEVGTFYGYSAIGMALAGATVLTIDPHNEGPANEPDTWPAFNAHVDRHRPLPAGIWPVRAYVEEWAQAHTGRLYGMAFIDGDHSEAATLRAGLLAAARLREPYTLAFHDYAPNWPGVVAAVGVLEARLGLLLLRVEGCLRVYRLGVVNDAGGGPVEHV